MALVQMWPPANGAFNSISFEGRTYTSVPGIPAQVQDFDVPILQANGWTAFPTAAGQNCVLMTSPVSGAVNPVTFDGRTYSTPPGTAINVPSFDVGILQANGWTSVTSGLPVNTAAPSISGAPQAGQTLTASTGTWTNSPTQFSYAWTYAVSGSVAGVASGNTYVSVGADAGQQIVVTVTATNSIGSSAPASSAPTAAVTSGGGSPALNFSIANNSQYIPALGA